jgi:hypothetical protein
MADGSAPKIGTVLFKSSFEHTPSSAWKLMRMKFATSNGHLRALSAPRDGFEYGHRGHGRSAAAFAHIGDATWTDYQLDLDIFGGGVGRFNPHGIDANMRGGFTVYFRAQDYKESWNEPSRTGYTIGVNPIPKLAEGKECESSLSRTNGWYVPRKKGWFGCDGSSCCRADSAPGRTKHLAAIEGSVWRIDEPNHVSVEVRGRSIRARINGRHALDFTDTDADALLCGGVGVEWGWENTGWLDNVLVTTLD